MLKDISINRLKTEVNMQYTFKEAQDVNQTSRPDDIKVAQTFAQEGIAEINIRLNRLKEFHEKAEQLIVIFDGSNFAAAAGDFAGIRQVTAALKSLEKQFHRENQKFFKTVYSTSAYEANRLLEEARKHFDALELLYTVEARPVPA
jgi:hypothetical protein